MSGLPDERGGKTSFTADSPTDLLHERDAARRLGLSVATLRRRRLNQQPPAWVKLGARVLYRVQDLESFIEAHLIRPLDTERESKQ